MSAKASKVSDRWHLRMVMAERGMLATSDLVPLLAVWGVTLSREQVYRLVAKVPERLSRRLRPGDHPCQNRNPTSG